jgi:hypothetical protein
MIKFKVERPIEWQKDTYTIGKFYIDYGNGWEYFCNTLEDTVRDLNHDGINEVKIWGKTAIPFGTYKITWAMSPTYKKLMPLLWGVKGFSGVLIHIGNKPEDTLGCILVGENKVKGQLINSTITFNKLYQIMLDSKQQEFTIEIV